MSGAKTMSSSQAIRTAYTVVTISHLLLLVLPSTTKSIESPPNTLYPGCKDSCGGISIPYPFGIGPNCSMGGFTVTCNRTNDGTDTPYLGVFPILNINLSLGEVVIDMPVSYQCYNSKTKSYDYTDWWMNVNTYHYRFNHQKNKITIIGCSTALGVVNFTNPQDSYLGGCVAGCDSLESLIDGSCSGIGCCQTSIPKGTNHIEFWFNNNLSNSEVKQFSRCDYAMITKEDDFTFNTSYITTDILSKQNMSAVIDWVIENTLCDTAQTDNSSFACISTNSDCVDSSSGAGYLCNCSEGYHGNPYLQGGCLDIDECANQNQCSKPGKCHNTQGGYYCSCPFGWRKKTNNECELNLGLVIGICASILGLSFLGFGIYVVLQRIKLSKVMEKYFDQHGGWILLEKIQANQDFGFTIFTKQQVEQATNNFDSANIIGHGGQGTVYKGTLREKVVAIKKCKIVNESKKKEFGKEMLILSQINHKNIVKLLGCCLEVEVPMLVYEYIPNNTLFHHIHYKNQGTCISLATRLSIAQESAEALAYLHFSASPPIIHGDVKSANILLDQNYTAKVSDFGASILAPTDEAQFVTYVQGTCGYLDPEYIQSCQLTDKSDVYSFGVVLMELLTRKPVIDFDASEEERSLLTCFLSAMKDNKIKDILDDEIKNEDNMEVIIEVADLTKKCLHLQGEERPTMKEVIEELDRIRKLRQHPWTEEHHPKEIEILLGEVSHDIKIEHTGYFSLEKKAGNGMVDGR